MQNLKWCTKEELSNYEKTSNWNTNVFSEFLIEKNSDPLFKKIGREAEFYQSLEFYLNKLSNELVLDSKNIASILKLKRKYKVIYTNFLGNYMLEFRGPDNYYINFKQDQNTKLFYFYSTNGNPVDAVDCFKGLMSNN